ncbi:helix-turn-helix domain-containing protein [Colwellia sp. Arc7-635]|uniref:helix-turn-helix domain-containing protein n=1 Tax=Colwellia sp. Arc7-635 TaxID=2497879 RepID=UPI000F855B07|nr:helix-turn-helix domain-containing protein [Colwellia sp. Arc7-635]AZQ84840.1 helix-turn-helix domain-containing protein [Colwellia sp. Arc7-635]
MKSAPNTLVLTEAVNKLLEANDLPAALTIEQCASALAMSMTSFRRKLAQEDTSYKLIQNKFINELSVQALLTKHANIDQLAIKLGYSERATFERAFRQKFGTTASKFRELSLVNSAENSYQKLSEIAENIPPMPKSCRQLVEEKDNGNLDLPRVIEIISQDVIFSGRLMGQASKAIYGRTPKNLTEAVSRNLGVDTVVNFAIVYAMRDTLQNDVNEKIIEQYSRAFLLAPKLFQCLRKPLRNEVKFDIAITEQVLVFALLGIFLLSHKAAYKHELMLHSLKGIDDVHSLNRHIKVAMGISIFSASSLMLSLWHIDATLVKQLNNLDNISQFGIKSGRQDELTLFMLSCLYAYAAKHNDVDALKQKAELLGINNFVELDELLSTA